MCEMLGDLYDWPLHMARKPWVDVEPFLEAFEHALRRFCPGDFDADRLARSAAEAPNIEQRIAGGAEAAGHVHIEKGDTMGSFANRVLDAAQGGQRAARPEPLVPAGRSVKKRDRRTGLRPG